MEVGSLWQHGELLTPFPKAHHGSVLYLSSTFTTRQRENHMLQTPHTTLSAQLTIESPITGSFGIFRGARLEVLSKQWRAIALEDRYAQPFYQPEWVRAYAHAFLDQDEIPAITTSCGDSLLGILPLSHRKTFFGKIPAHSLVGVSGMHSCRFDLIHAPNQRETVARETWRVLRDHLKWTTVEMLDVPRDGAFHRVLELARQDGFLIGHWSTRKMPILEIPPLPASPFSNCPPTHKVSRTRLEKKLRKLKEQGTVSLGRIAQAGRTEVEQFIRLESAGWKGREGSAIYNSPRTLDFYNATTQAASLRKYLRLYSLELNGEPIAMYLGFLMNNTVFMPKIAYDERYSVYSPGQILTKLVIEDLAR